MAGDFSAQDVEASISNTFGRTCRVYDEVGSTNDVAAQWARDHAPEGAVVVAHHQTGGRGRYGRSWLSEPQRALLFSVILRPPTGARLGLIPIALGVGCAEAIGSIGLEARIKWPNDVLVTDLKVAGILTETESGGPSSAVIAGLGINFDWTRAELPAEILERATSVADECMEAGVETPTRLELLVKTLDALSSSYALLPDRADEVLRHARERSTLLGTTIHIHLPGGGSFSGRAVGLADDGGLVVSTDDGERIVHSGEVEKVRAG